MITRISSERAGDAAKAGKSTAIRAMAWYRDMPHPVLEARIGAADSEVTLRHFIGTTSKINQPSLYDNVLAIHLGGAKRVRRWQNGQYDTWDVERNSMTFMPAYRHNRWVTEGPVEYAHLTLGVEFLRGLAAEEFDRDPGEILLLDRVGEKCPLSSQLLLSMLEDAHSTSCSVLYQESLLTALSIAVLKFHSTLTSSENTKSFALRGRHCGGLAGWQLRRLKEYMAANLATAIGTAELVPLTGLSRAHFFRAFRQSTGLSPHAFLTSLRIERAKTLLMAADADVKTIARSLGFGSPRQFSALFRRYTGVSPKIYCRCKQ